MNVIVRAADAIAAGATRIARAFESANPTPQRPARRSAHLSADSAVELAMPQLRQWGIWLDENVDFADAVLDDHVDMIVGDGVTILPRVRTATGADDDVVNTQLADLLERWSPRAELTGELAWEDLQQQATRGRAREGEVFVREHIDLQSDVGLKLELLESAYCPIHFTDAGRGWLHGIQHDIPTRMPLAYAMYREHPGDEHLAAIDAELVMRGEDLDIWPAELVMHVKRTRRWPQVRGIPLTTTVIPRAHGIHDYMQSEMTSARQNARVGLVKIKDAERGYRAPATRPKDQEGEQPSFELPHGTMYTDLLVGERVEMLRAERPNSECVPFLRLMFQLMASATATRYSRISGNFLEGTYSGQRQETNEAHFATRRDAQYIRRALLERTWRRLVEIWVLQGRVDARGRSLDELSRALYLGSGLPPIDRQKESAADIADLEAGILDLETIQLRRGIDPRKIRSTSPVTREENDRAAA